MKHARATIVDELRRRVDRLEQEMRKRPVRQPPGGTPVVLRTVVIIGGNTLATGQAGCKYSATPITSVPSAYDPAVDTSFIDGICVGTLFENGISTGTKVLVLNDSTATPQRALVVGDVVAVQSTVAQPVVGDPNGATVSMYPAFWL